MYHNKTTVIISNYISRNLSFFLITDRKKYCNQHKKKKKHQKLFDIYHKYLYLLPAVGHTKFHKN